MGFRTTMTSSDTTLEIPGWFSEKYPNLIYGRTAKGTPRLPMSLIAEIKFYKSFKETELFLDIQKIMVEQKITWDVVLILLHECHGVSKVHINQTTITGMEPLEWEIVEGVTHDYCYGCSDPNKAVVPLTSI